MNKAVIPIAPHSGIIYKGRYFTGRPLLARARLRGDRRSDVRREGLVRLARPQYELARRGDGKARGERVDDKEIPHPRPTDLRTDDRHPDGPDHDEADVQERARGRGDLALAPGLAAPANIDGGRHD